MCRPSVGEHVDSARFHGHSSRSARILVGERGTVATRAGATSLLAMRVPGRWGDLPVGVDFSAVTLGGADHRSDPSRPNRTTMFSSGISPATARAGCAPFGVHALPVSSAGNEAILPASSNDRSAKGNPSPPSGSTASLT